MSAALVIGSSTEIPSTKRRTYLEENMAALQIELNAEDLAEFNRIAPVGSAAGARYPEPAWPL